MTRFNRVPAAGSTPLSIYTEGNAPSYFFLGRSYSRRPHRCGGRHGCHHRALPHYPRQGRPYYLQEVVPAKDLASTIPLAFDYIMQYTRPT
jgi:hypothetical protein